MDRELIEEIEAAVGKNRECRLLSSDAAATIVNRVGSSLVADVSRLWWWDSLKVPRRIWEYGETDPIPRIKRLLQGSNRELYLVVTDESPPPWLIVRGDINCIEAVLYACRYFEYFICEDSGSWAIFDTHHSCIVFAGSLRGQSLNNGKG